MIGGTVAPRCYFVDADRGKSSSESQVLAGQQAAGFRNQGVKRLQVFGSHLWFSQISQCETSFCHSLFEVLISASTQLGAHRHCLEHVQLIPIRLVPLLSRSFLQHLRGGLVFRYSSLLSIWRTSNHTRLHTQRTRDTQTHLHTPPVADIHHSRLRFLRLTMPATKPTLCNHNGHHHNFHRNRDSTKAMMIRTTPIRYPSLHLVGRDGIRETGRGW